MNDPTPRSVVTVAALLLAIFFINGFPLVMSQFFKKVVGTD
jgi:hypothetical protein